VSRCLRPTEDKAEWKILRREARAKRLRRCPRCGGSFRLVRVWGVGELYRCRQCGTGYRLTFGFGPPPPDAKSL
jgi:predicted RNA-binding Zn-ribbon protein involved in translation (DUF1610 family)